MIGLLGRKLGMAAIFSGEGALTPVTLIDVRTNHVARVKSHGRDGYGAVVMALGHVGSAESSQRGRRGRTRKPVLAEFRVDEPEQYKPGQALGADVFEVGDIVRVIGETKGRGFAGTVKRHGFAGSKQTHGAETQRLPGSIGQSASPARVWKGQKMAGRMGGVRRTVRGLSIVRVEPGPGIVMVRGAIPGARGGLVRIVKQESG
jgi:large subunit ribosomal protein L3